MTLEQAGVCSRVLENTFGDMVEKVGSHLISKGPLTLSQIAKNIKVDKSEIKKSLLVLVQHQLVSFDTRKSQQVVYNPELATILGMCRYPRWIHTGQQLGKEPGELIIEDILLHGQTSLTHCVKRVTARLNESNGCNKFREDRVAKVFEGLVEQRYLTRVRSHSFDNSSSSQPIPAIERFSVPVIVGDLMNRKRGRSHEKGEEPVSKRSRKYSETEEQQISDDDDDTLWYLNLHQFHKHYRHQRIIQAVGEKIDATSSIIIKAIVKAEQREEFLGDAPLYSDTGPEVYPSQIMDSLPNTLTLARDELEQYLAILMEEQFVTKTGDAGGGSYCINYKRCSELLCQAVLESVVRERFGSKPLRLFRLLLLKKYLEQKQITDMALIPNKESKEMLYSLLAENFVSLQEVPRANDYTPSRTFYLFSVNKIEVSRVVLQKSYKALGNLMTRRKHEMNENKRLLEKYTHWERQQAQLGGVAGEDPIEEVITPSEREAAEKVKFNIEKLEQGELQLDDTIFAIEDYLGYLTNSEKQAKQQK